MKRFLLLPLALAWVSVEKAENCSTPTPSLFYAPTEQTYEPQMVSVQGGEFKMTNNYTVSLSDYAIGKFEITVKQYMSFVKEMTAHLPEWLEVGNKFNIKTGKNNHYSKLGDVLENAKNPIVGVSWHDAVAYCAWLSRKTGKKYRLPTEAEWEFAARGGNQTKGYTYSGSNDIDAVAWYDTNSGSTTHAVGSKQANELGIFDMSGNVWEWCSDWFGAYPTGSFINPTGAISGTFRVCRGGAWSNQPSVCRSTNRYNGSPTYRDSYLGFRVVREK